MLKKKILTGVMVISLLAAGTFFVAKRQLIQFHIKQSTANFSLISNELFPRDNEYVSGIFYKTDTHTFKNSPGLRHFVLQLNNKSSLKIDKSVLSDMPEHHNILLTIEFWGNRFQHKYRFNNEPLQDIISGSLDTKLQKIYDTLLDSPRDIYVRINPEMELWVYNTPWENSDDYIEAYRYVVRFWQKKNPNLKFVWGPAGFNGAERFYPGDDVVDFISITLQSEAEKMYTRYPAYTSIQNEVHRKLHRMRFFNKPVMILNDATIKDNSLVISAVNSEIDTITKYRHVAYDETLWNNSEPSVQNEKFHIGLYDPRQLLVNDPAITVEHLFLNFGHLKSGEADKRLNDAFSRKHNVIVTFEPWEDYGSQDDPNVLNNITDGKYDDLIHQLYHVISGTEYTVYLRFAHEMEIPITRYTWQSKDPVTYIKAFRYFMQFPAIFPENVKRVWGPAGDRGAPDFYPGDDVVDYLSFAAYGLPDKDITDFNKQRTFSSIFKDKIKNYRHINKPIFITEFGVKGPDDYKMQWMEDAALTLNENPQVIGVNYFNMSDTPGAWGDIKEPDWSISSRILHRFLEVLKRDDQ